MSSARESRYLPELRRDHRLIPVKKHSRLQVVEEFRAKLKTIEDLMSKLAFSLREIQGSRVKKSKEKAPSHRNNVIVPGRFQT